MTELSAPTVRDRRLQGRRGPSPGLVPQPARDPDAVTIEVGGRRIPVRPREVGGAEREELWRLVNDNYNGYQVYQQRAGQRIIPVVLLEPA